MGVPKIPSYAWRRRKLKLPKEVKTVVFACIGNTGRSFAAAKLLEKRFKVSSGVSYAIMRFLHYGIVVVGVIVAAQIVGLNLGSLAVLFALVDEE